MDVMDFPQPSARWFFWEAGLLCSLWAIATTPVDRPDYGAFAMVTLLFIWGLVRH